MNKKNITTVKNSPVKDGICSLNGEEMYRISNIDRLDPFLMSITSSEDHWMFVSSTGSLTAGRINEEGCLFPYETEDKLHRNHTHTGPVTVIRFLYPKGITKIWRPFTNPFCNDLIHRHLYKNALGNHVVFEEINNELELIFRYSWRTSGPFGFVRTATIENLGESPVNMEILDGLLNIMPSGLELNSQQSMSNLADAYKRSEFDTNTGLGIYSIEAVLMDQPDPSESLKANVVWCNGLANYTVDLHEKAVSRFITGKKPEYTHLLTGRRGAYLIHTGLMLKPSSGENWDIIADVDQDQRDVVALQGLLQDRDNLCIQINDSIMQNRAELNSLIASADGLQMTADQVGDYHHGANVLFNIMRGGVFRYNYSLEISDLCQFINERNKYCFENQKEILEKLPSDVNYIDLLRKADQTSDPDFIRLCYEYVPIMFSRRHGDPSRPWNRFDIHIKRNDGSRLLNYQGNWRDIFQNWEALCFSYPEFIESIIAKFVNASTVDGFNPYRITRDGIDWEKSDQDNSWATIGYWGDHQIIYLLKFLEASRQFHPDLLVNMLEKPVFSYGNIPYRIKPYNEIIENSKNTIDFDFKLDALIEISSEQLGADAKLLLNKDQDVYHVTLLEKLLVPFLSKLSNLIPDGGIWMNTQRPEWNDANNALVGNGISMVTLFYLRRYTQFLIDTLVDISNANYQISTEIIQWIRDISKVLTDYQPILKKTAFDDINRRQLMDSLGSVFFDYRENVYSNGFSGTKELSKKEIIQLLKTSMDYFDHAIKVNQRSDNLYHTYNLLDISSSDSASIIPQYEMLEGQVAALSSGELNWENALSLLDTLFESSMYCKNRNSFMLYPKRELPTFLEKNIIPDELVSTSSLLKKLIAEDDESIILKDSEDTYRFHSSFKNVDDLNDALFSLSQDSFWRELVHSDSCQVRKIYEQVFNHQAFTGRSGSMYSYEGIGSIYWHMVSKLMLATQEVFFKALSEGEDKTTLQEIGNLYYRIRGGLSAAKTPEEYGAFPFDPYSHTPFHSGAQQPGMTGQVKEEIITRYGELGISVNEGVLSFLPRLLQKKEFLSVKKTFSYYNIHGNRHQLELKPDSLMFTYCQIPIIYKLTSEDFKIHIYQHDKIKSIDGTALSLELSQEIFKRTGRISLIQIQIPEDYLIF